MFLFFFFYCLTYVLDFTLWNFHVFSVKNGWDWIKSIFEQKSSVVRFPPGTTLLFWNLRNTIVIPISHRQILFYTLIDLCVKFSCIFNGSRLRLINWVIESKLSVPGSAHICCNFRKTILSSISHREILFHTLLHIVSSFWKFHTFLTVSNFGTVQKTLHAFPSKTMKKITPKKIWRSRVSIPVPHAC